MIVARWMIAIALGVGACGVPAGDDDDDDEIDAAEKVDAALPDGGDLVGDRPWGCGGSGGIVVLVVLVADRARARARARVRGRLRARQSDAG